MPDISFAILVRFALHSGMDKVAIEVVQEPHERDTTFELKCCTMEILLVDQSYFIWESGENILGKVGNSAQGTVMKRPALPTHFTKIESEKFI